MLCLTQYSVPIFYRNNRRLHLWSVPCLHSSVSDSGTVDRCCLQVQKRMHQKLCCHACSDACDRTDGDHARQWKSWNRSPLIIPVIFDDIFARYLTRCELVQVKTTNMGSLFKLEYRIVFREEGEEKNMIDQLRCRNGNLEILCSRAQTGREEL